MFEAFNVEFAAQFEKERYRQLLSESAVERLLRSDNPRSPRWHQRLLLSIGNVFVTCGLYLRQLSAMDSAAPAWQRR